MGMVIAAIIGFWFGRVVAPYRFQNASESRIRHALSEQFGSADYHLLNHVTLRLHYGTTQIDHILVSRFGVFVIETKDYSGWIFAHASWETWTQVLYKAKFRFQNPLRQNQGHVAAVRNLLDFLPPEQIYSLVAFTGKAEFKTPMPAGVFDVPGLIQHLQSRRSELMTLNRMQFCVGRLETARLALSRVTDVEHVASVKRRQSRRQ